jgi:hypothetical protein
MNKFICIYKFMDMYIHTIDIFMYSCIHDRCPEASSCSEDPECVAHCIRFEEIRTILLCLGVLTEYVPR